MKSSSSLSFLRGLFLLAGLPLEKARPPAGPPHPGLALVPSEHNPRVRRWQQMESAEAVRQGHPTLHGLLAEARGHLDRLGPATHLGDGHHVADMEGPLLRLGLYAQGKTKRYSESDAHHLHGLVERARLYRPAPSLERVHALTPAQHADVALHGRKYAGADKDGPWARAGQAALTHLRAALSGADPKQPAVRLAMLARQTADAAERLPAEAWLPEVQQTAGQVRDQLRHVELHAHRALWRPEVASELHDRMEAASALVEQQHRAIQAWRAPPSHVDIVAMSDADLAGFARSAQALAGRGSRDPWAQAAYQASVELADRRHPRAAEIEARRKEMERVHDLDGHVARATHRGPERGTSVMALIEAAARREAVRRELLAAGHHDAAARLFPLSDVARPAQAA